MKIPLLRPVACVALAALALSCNLFAPAPADRDDYARRRGAEGLIIEGKVLMRDGKWEEAYNLFIEALGKDSSKSEAWYYSGKCILRMADVDLNDVWGEVNPAPGSRDVDAVPFLYKEGYIYSSGACSAACDLCRNDTCLTWRHLGDTLPTPFIYGNNVAFTVVDSVFLQRKRIYDAVCKSIAGLEYIYYNSDKMDGMILRKQYESDYLVEIGVRTVLTIIDINNNDTLDYGTPSAPSNEREVFRIFCADIQSLKDVSLDSIKSISTDPKLINGKIDELLVTILKADTSYGNFKDQIVTAHMDSNMAGGLGDMVHQFKTIIPYYYYDDCLDNDGNYYDTDNDGHIDRTIWIDWDHDGLIDVNPPGVLPHVHIGQQTHRWADSTKANYESIDLPGADFARYRYKGPHTYEFIFGDWGVDEEIMEGDDNTFDSLVDEDSRVVDDTLDDDGDAFSRGLKVTSGKDAPMVWNDANNNLRLGITTNDTKMKTGKYLAIARLIWADNRTKDSRDWDTTGLSDTTIATFTGAPPSGEFINGTYGVDEEWFDGLDNDGDGLIDEDVGKTSQIPPESQRATLIATLSANHTALHAYWKNIQNYWTSLRGSAQ